MNEQPIKAIETLYKGYRFRSRLEARWAVFFDAITVQYEYEPQGFSLGGVAYLPDFWLPTLGWWLEIKPSIEMAEADKEKFGRFHEASNARSGRFRIVVGNPWFDSNRLEHSYQMFVCVRFEHTAGDPPEVLRRCPEFNLHGMREYWRECPLCRGIDIEALWLSGDRELSTYCQTCDMDGPALLGDPDDRAWFHKGDICANHPDVFVTPRLRFAYQAARSARFEHGETPLGRN